MIKLPGKDIGDFRQMNQSGLENYHYSEKEIVISSKNQCQYKIHHKTNTQFIRLLIIIGSGKVRR